MDTGELNRLVYAPCTHLRVYVDEEGEDWVREEWKKFGAISRKSAAPGVVGLLTRMPSDPNTLIDFMILFHDKEFALTADYGHVRPFDDSIGSEENERWELFDRLITGEMEWFRWSQHFPTHREQLLDYYGDDILKDRRDE